MIKSNVDEALRAKGIAEKKFHARDVTAAKRFALKAQNLDPNLDGISQMVATLDIHLAADVVVNGERDWYSVLSVNASADDETVKRQYRKLALMLHPDKNKSVGAETAFKLVSEAWNALGDKSRRMAYDYKRGISQSYGYTNGFTRCTSNKSSNLRNQKNAARVVADPSPAYPPRLDTFWTSCHHCRMQYEYLRVYLNHNLLCPNCHGPFLATEIRNPITGHCPPASWSSSQWQQSSNHSRKPYRQRKNASSVAGMGAAAYQHGADFAYGVSNGQSDAFSRPSGGEYASMHGQKRPADFNGVLPDGRGRRSILSSADRPGKKRRALNENGSVDCGQNVLGDKNGVCREKEAFNVNATPHVENGNGSFVECDRNRTIHRQTINLKKELSVLDIRNLLMKKAQTLVQGKLDGWASAAASAKSAEGQAKVKEKQEPKASKKETTALTKESNDKSKSGKTSNHIKQVPAEKNVKDMLEQPSVNFNREVQKLKSIDVPDSDFHDFDKDRSERSFEPDQVWATYDDEDGMPRYYALIQKVISLKPFKICMSFLNSKSNRELGPLNWVGKGFAKTCGDFRVGRYVTNDSINVFSHRVQWGRGVRGAIRIVPRKGSIWALYRNWSPDWNELTPDDVIYKYDMMEVLDDYDEEQGVAVVPLVKVAGFKALFHRHMDPKEVRRIPREEMFRFSHQVPSYYLTGTEAQNAPQGCHELDPAATPVELLRVITEA